MFELNSIRELNHRLARLMDLSGQKQYIAGGNVQQRTTGDHDPINDVAVSENTQRNYGFRCFF